MSWLSEEDFRTLWVPESATEIPSAQITECLDSAIADITKLVDSNEITALVADTGNTLLPTKSIRRAQSKLAYRELLLFLSNRFRSGGIQLKERDENASTTNEYESADKTDLRRRSLWTEAMDILEPYFGEETKEEDVTKFRRSTSKTIDFTW